ncbi:hypothetical protein J2Z42_002169 [Clostridium algifaecis]|uniref:Amidoligase n=1 Tax=Clostridium algifaecis TaxID=1472040 RepID=A0ABS4KTT5_9CLOT|nr:amidoligase family protein [Clostridium algifaecis]MBP2033466.1 hypothetical protein [Clostridium algifaecis]
MKDLNFGIEIELTGVTREKAATTIGAYFGVAAKYVGGAYDSFEIKDSEDRIWKVVNDSSLNPQRKEGKGIVEADNKYRVEVVSPICKYEDIETVQEIVRALRKEGAFENKSTGIHIHVDKSPFTAKTLRNLVNIMASKEDLIYKALKVESRREGRYCKKVDKNFLNMLNKRKPDTLEEFANLWYENYFGEDRHRKYNTSRYRGLNLHSFFNGNTVEMRFLNSCTHAGKIKSYIQLCLAICNQALNQSSASPKKTESSNPKYTFRTWLLRLGLIGEEFETARYHLLKELEGDIAFRYGRPERIAAGE